MNTAIPKTSLILMEDFRKIEEVLGWDLDDVVISRIREARHDRERGNKDAHVDLESI